MRKSQKTICQPAVWALALTFALAAGGCNPAHASSLTQKDVQILAKAIGFLEPPPTGPATVAIAYDPADPASKADADAIAGYFGDGLKAGGAVLKPKVTEVGQLAVGSFVAVIAANGVKIDQVSASAPGRSTWPASPPTQAQSRQANA